MFPQWSDPGDDVWVLDLGVAPSSRPYVPPYDPACELDRDEWSDVVDAWSALNDLERRLASNPVSFIAARIDRATLRNLVRAYHPDKRLDKRTRVTDHLFRKAYHAYKTK